MRGYSRVALVTGASSGLGVAIAHALASDGWAVGLLARRRERLEAVAAGIRREGGEAYVFAGDVRAQAFAEKALKELTARTGRLDLLVNNAGAPTPTQGEVATDTQFDEVFALNVRAAYRLSHLALSYLEATGGSIVNVGSAAVARNIPADLVYLASKGALETLSLGMAKRWAPLGVRVNTVSPGIVPTEIVERAGYAPEAARELVAAAVDVMQPLPRGGQPEDIGKAVSYLASASAAFVTGATLHVDGGMALGG